MADWLIDKKACIHAMSIALVFACIFIVFFYSVLFSDHLLINDGLIPADFRVGEWSNFIFSGYPLAADAVLQAYYPLRGFFYRVLMLDFNFFVISSYFLMAYFTYGYVYALTRLKTAAFIAGLIFSFSGYAMFEIEHAVNFMHTICWLPLILLSFEKLRKDVSFFWSLIGLLSIAMTVLGGFIQLTLAVFPVFLSYAFFVYVQTERQPLKLWCYWSLIVTAYLCVTPLIIQTVVLALFSSRVHLSWDMFCSFYVKTKQLLLFNFPYLMGGYYGVYAKAPNIGDWQMVGNHGFVGFLSLILAGIGLYSPSSSLRPYTRYWLFFCLLSVLIALGPEVKLFYKLMYYIPIINNFRAPERYLFIFSFGVSVLAGIGVHAMQQSLVNLASQRRAIILYSLLLAVILLSTVFAIYPSLQRLAAARSLPPLPPFYKNMAVIAPAFWMMLSLCGLYIWLKKPISLCRCLLVIIILSGELLSTAYFANWHPSVSSWTKNSLSTPPAYVNELRSTLNRTHQRYLKMQREGDLLGKYLWGNFSIYYHLPNAGGYLPLALLRYLDFLQIDSFGVYVGEPDQLQHNQAINILGIKYLVTIPTPENDRWFKDKTQFKLQKKLGETWVYENTKARPKAWFTSKVRTLSSSDMLSVIHSGKFPDGSVFDPAYTALVESPQHFNFEMDDTAEVTIKRIEDHKIILQTHTAKPQFLVLNDLYYPGWIAYLDGKKTKIVVTDYIIRGMIVPSGDHVVTYAFHPFYLYLSYGIACFSFLMFVYCNRSRLVIFKKPKTHVCREY